MSGLVVHLLEWNKSLAFEFQRFVLLWRFQHRATPFRLWWRLVLKRLVDLVVVLAGLLLSAPLLALIVLAIRLDSKGAVLYLQERVGRFGELFTMYKFRTMVVEAEAHGPVWADPEDDPRVTRVGRWLRRTHLDELPQLLNIAQGHMSLVGPRPERPCFVQRLDRAIPGYESRLLVKPGITGLAQVHYRYDQTVADVKRKLRFDLLYVKRMCLMLDARIVVWTLFVVVTGRGIVKS